jgi:MinD-like ATPase involved in chromosome partitioning or flagellar assembly
VRREQLRDYWRQIIRQPLTAPKMIAVLSARGGTGKTTTAAHLGHVLAMVRGDLAVALDANPDSGNLVMRLGEPRSAYGAPGLHRAADHVLRCTDLLPYVTQADSGLWVVRSEADDGTRLGADEYQRMVRVLSRYSSVIVADLGTGMREPVLLALAGAAHALVAVAAPTTEAVEAAVDAIDGINQRLPDRNRAAVIAVSAVSAHSAELDTAELAAASDFYVDQVLQIPHDPHLATGAACRWALLSQHTQDAYLELAATIIGLLSGRPGRTERKNNE